MIIIETIRDIAIALGLAIIIPLTIDVGFKAFAPIPTFSLPEDVIKLEKMRNQLDDQARLLEAEKKFDEADQLKKKAKNIEIEFQAASKPFWERYKKLEWIHENLREPLMIGLGFLLIVLTFFIKIMSISFGFIIGGMTCLVWGLGPWFWSLQHAQAQFFILLGAVIMLIILSYFFFMRRRKRL